jgi:hypothetical protein
MNSDDYSAYRVDMWAKLTPFIPGSWLRREAGAAALVTPVPWAAINGVWVEHSVARLPGPLVRDSASDGPLPRPVQHRRHPCPTVSPRR